MSTGNQIPAISVLRAAVEARDVAAVVQAFARDAKIHSSLTAQLTFIGHHHIAAIISVFFDVFDDPHCTDEVLSAGAGYLVSRESRRTGIKIVDLLRSGRDSKIQGLTVFLPATTSERRRAAPTWCRTRPAPKLGPGRLHLQRHRLSAFRSRAADRLVEPHFATSIIDSSPEL